MMETGGTSGVGGGEMPASEQRSQGTGTHPSSWVEIQLHYLLAAACLLCALASSAVICIMGLIMPQGLLGRLKGSTCKRLRIVPGMW